MQNRFSKAMQSFGMTSLSYEAGCKIAVAVSGGGDSIALAHFLKNWASPQGITLVALTVDHGLRAESAAEAQKVTALMAQHNIEHHILKWQGEKPTSHIQERARHARYDLLAQSCVAQGIKTLAVAHNAEDQMETFWMRLAHGSGLDGLCGMADRREMTQGVQVIRPLLCFGRAELRDYCVAHNLPYVDDPSNQDEKYLRVRLRQFESVLLQEGMSPQRLQATLEKLSDAKSALDFYAEKEFLSLVTFHDEGYLSLDVSSLLVLPREMQRRLLGRALRVLSPANYPPGFERLDAITTQLQEGIFAGTAFLGCEIFIAKEKIIICREVAAAAPRQAVRDGMVWDDRFLVQGIEGCEVGVLGEAGLEFLRKSALGTEKINKNAAHLPFQVKKTLPALWRAEKLLYVPHLSWQEAESAPLSEHAPTLRFLGLNIV